MQLAHYLLTRLREAGVDCTFGIPGDFVLPLYAAQQEFGMRTVVCNHEPGAAFAADAYARLKGMGVVLATYGAGALNLLNPVAMSYAEHSPLVVVSGAPESGRRGPDVYLHHLVKRYESQLRIFREVTEDAEILTIPARAPESIDRVLRTALRLKRPVYLELPRDLTGAEVGTPAGPLLQPQGAPPVPQGALDEALEEIRAWLARAQAPVLYAGVGVRRFGLMDAAVQLARNWGLPVVTSVMGKAAVPESMPAFVGVYMGALGDPDARRVLEESDCVVSLGVIRSDVNTGFFTAKYDPRVWVDVGEIATQVRYHRYEGIGLAQLLPELARCVPPQARPAPQIRRTPPCEAPCAGSTQLKICHLIQALQRLDQARYSFVADVGESWFVGLELRPDIFIAPGYYATMGFAVPGGLGAGLADRSRRPFILVGDGAFRMTGNELSVLVAQGLNPIVLLLNNSCYTMLEALDRPRDYYSLSGWDYQLAAQSQGAQACRAATLEQFQQALARAVAEPRPWLIEALLEKTDLSPVMRRIQAHFAKTSRLKQG